MLDASLDDAGTLDLLPALRLFAAGYAPVPGVTAAPEALLDGGPAVRSILAHLGELSADQVAAVTAVLDQPGVPLQDARASSSPRLVKAAELVGLAVGLFSDLLDRQLPDGVEVTIVELPYANADGTRNFSSPTAFATAVPVTESNDVPYEECRVRVNADAPLGGDSVDDPAFVSGLAQEAFHCLQFGQRPFGEGVPMWAMEGAAAFAGEDFAQGSTLSTAWWGRWIGEPQRPIDRRTYDAAGFFFLLQGTVDPYRYSDAFLAEATEDSIRRRLEGTDVFDRWGSQYATEPGWGPQYAVAGVGVPATPAPQDTLALTVDGPRVAAAGLTATTEMSGTAYRFVVPGDVLVVTSGAGDRGWLRFADGTEQKLSEATRSFCLRPDGCVCPGVAPDAATADQVASTELFIGVGPSSGGGPDLAARSLQQWCNEVLVPAPPEGALDPCLAADWTSTGYVVSPVAGLDQQVTGGDGASLRLHPDHTAHLDLERDDARRHHRHRRRGCGHDDDAGVPRQGRRDVERAGRGHRHRRRADRQLHGAGAHRDLGRRRPRRLDHPGRRHPDGRLRRPARHRPLPLQRRRADDHPRHAQRRRRRRLHVHRLSGRAAGGGPPTSGVTVTAEPSTVASPSTSSDIPSGVGGGNTSVTAGRSVALRGAPRPASSTTRRPPSSTVGTTASTRGRPSSATVTR